jgi:PleD family two-component response regulator
MLTQLMGGELKVGARRAAACSRSVYSCRAYMRARGGSGGTRRADPRCAHRLRLPRPRRILVVDNERVDRELLLNILQPLGFEVRRQNRASNAWTNMPASSRT